MKLWDMLTVHDGWASVLGSLHCKPSVLAEMILGN